MASADIAMDRHLAKWKYELDRFWSAHAPDYREAMQLAREIASVAENEALRQAASQALPILRSAAEEGAGLSCPGNGSGLGDSTIFTGLGGSG